MTSQQGTLYGGAGAVPPVAPFWVDAVGVPFGNLLTSAYGNGGFVALSFLPVDGIILSPDNGATFSQVTIVPAGGEQRLAMCYADVGPGTPRFLAVSSTGRVWFSDDNGATWTIYTLAGGVRFEAVTFSNALQLFVIMAFNSNDFWTSSTGLSGSWAQRPLPSIKQMRRGLQAAPTTTAIAAIEGAGTLNLQGMSSTNGTAFTNRATPSPLMTCRAIGASDAIMFAAETGSGFRSLDGGVTYTQTNPTVTNGFSTSVMAYATPWFVSSNSTGDRCLSSLDCLVWNEQLMGASPTPRSACAGPGIYFLTYDTAPFVRIGQ